MTHPSGHYVMGVARAHGWLRERRGSHLPHWRHPTLGTLAREAGAKGGWTHRVDGEAVAKYRRLLDAVLDIGDAVGAWHRHV